MPYMAEMRGVGLFIKLLAVVSIGVVWHPELRGQDPLPPDAGAILRPESPDDAEAERDPKSIPHVDELTDPNPESPVTFPAEREPVPATEVAGLPPAEVSGADVSSASPESSGTESSSVSPDSPAPKSALPAQPVEVGFASEEYSLVRVLAGSCPLLFLPLGFALFAAGSTRAKNVGHTLSMSLCSAAAAIAGFALTGFALQMGGLNAAQSVSKMSGALATSSGLANMGGFSSGEMYFGIAGFAGWGTVGLSPSDLGIFVRMSAIVAGFATILAGAYAERMKLSAFIVLSLFIGAVIYPLPACWAWGGGLLAALGANFGMGHGFVDIAGAGVIHIGVSAAACAGIVILGARYGKYNKDGSTNPIPGHNITFVIAGTMILVAGWLGFVAGDLRLSASASAMGAASVMIGAAGGTLGGLVASWMTLRKPDPYLFSSGTIAGLVSVSASLGLASPAISGGISFLGGVLVVVALLIVERRLKLDDPAGVIAIHGVAGALGILLPGIVSSGMGIEGLNGVPGAVLASSGQLAAQTAGGVAIFGFVFVASITCLVLLKMTIGVRVELRNEVAGLDLPELGALGYQPDLNPDSRGPRKR
jgi:Amt family ammonium transporter